MSLEQVGQIILMSLEQVSQTKVTAVPRYDKNQTNVAAIPKYDKNPSTCFFSLE